MASVFETLTDIARLWLDS